MADALRIQRDKVAADEAVPAPADAHALDALADGGPHDRPHRGVHARGVAAAGQHADPFDLSFHRSPRSFPSSVMTAA